MISNFIDATTHILHFIIIDSSLLYLNTPQLCCGDEHETDIRLLKTISNSAKNSVM
jgi:hypothetical protein